MQKDRWALTLWFMGVGDRLLIMRADFILLSWWCESFWSLWIIEKKLFYCCILACLLAFPPSSLVKFMVPELRPICW